MIEVNDNVVTLIQHGEKLVIHRVQPNEIGKVNEYGKPILRVETCLSCRYCGENSYNRNRCSRSHKDGYSIRGTVCTRFESSLNV